MISAAKIGGGDAGTSGLTRHLMNATLAPEQDQSRMAAYYGRGAVIDTALLEAARAIADKEMSFGEALDGLVSGSIEAGGDLARMDEWELRTSDRLSALVLRIDADRENGTDTLNAPVAIIRPDIHPIAARGLGIEQGDILAPQEIDALLAGRRADNEPVDGKTYATERQLPIDPKTGKDRRSMVIGSYDFTVSPDKTVSVAWAFSNDLERAKIYNCHMEASREAISLLAERLGRARVGDGGKDGFIQGHCGWLEFTHHTSRRVTQSIKDGVSEVTIDKGTAADPDLHTHFLLHNSVFCEDGRVGSLDTAGLRGFQYECDAFYHARLGTKLQEAGFDIVLNERTGSAKMVAISDAVSTHFSKRTNIGEALAKKYIADRGQDWDSLSAENRATLVKNATQSWEQKKRGEKDEVANFGDWNRQATEIGWARPSSFLAYGPPAPVLEPDVRQRMAYDIAQDRLAERLENKAVLTHHELRVAAYQGLIHAGNAGGVRDADAVTQLMRDEGVKQYGERTAIVWGQEPEKRHVSVTTTLHQAHEAEFVRLAKAAAEDRSGAIPPAILAEKLEKCGLDFTDAHGKSQREAIERLGAGGRLGVILATAGAGKSAAIQPLAAAWKAMGRDVWGASLAWRQTDDLAKSGIDSNNLKAFSVLMKGLDEGSIRLTHQSVVVVDELALLGTRQGLELLRHRETQGFSIAALGDDKQLTSIKAGAIVDLCRVALGTEQIPEILTTRRQQGEREKKAVGLLRDGQAAEYLAMKRADGCAELVPGRAEDVIARTAALYRERLVATGQTPSISTPMNADAHLIGLAVRKERRAMGLVGPDLQTIKATDGERNYALTLAKGDRIRLFQSVRADGTMGSIGRNGSVLEVVDVGDRGVTLQNARGKSGLVRWGKLQDETTGRVKLAYGDCQTIHTSQGSTAAEHIISLPHGSKDITAGGGYSAATRHEMASYLLTSALAEYVEVKASRPMNDIRPITDNDRWANVAGHLVNREKKDLASTLRERTGSVRTGSVRSFQESLQPVEHRRSLGQSPSDAPEILQQQKVSRGIRHVAEAAHEMAQAVVDRVREAAEQIAERADDMWRSMAEAGRKIREEERARHPEQHQEQQRGPQMQA